MKVVKRYVKPDGKEFVAFEAPDGRIIIALDPHAYQDIVNMPGTIDVGFGVQIYNYTASRLYFTVEGSGGGAPWSWASPKQLDFVNSGANRYIHVPSLGSRSKPVSAVDDGVTLTFRAYEDAGYTVEVGSGYPVVVTYHWIDSDAMTLLDLDDFDAGNLEGWTRDSWEALGVVTEYVLSSPYAARSQHDVLLSSVARTGYIGKSFTVPSASMAFLIANVKYVGFVASGQSGAARVEVRELLLSKAGAIIARTGASPFLMIQPYNVQNRQTNWLRMVAPIDVDETAEYRIMTRYYLNSSSSARVTRLRAYYDNLKVVYS